MLYHVAIFDVDAPDETGYAQHSNQYLAALTALLSIHAKATHANFEASTYGALESFYPPTTLQGLMDYCTEIGYTVQVREMATNDPCHTDYSWP